MIPEQFETNRLLLKKYTPSEYSYLFQNYQKDEIIDILGFDTIEEYNKEYNKYSGSYSSYNRSLVFFQLICKEDNRIIGGAGFHNWMDEHKRAELGYALKSDSDKGKGYMSEAVLFIIDYGFQKMDLHRIEAFVGKDNVPSLKLMDKFGFIKEGHMREHYFINDVFEDSVVFSLLKNEYVK